MIMQRDPLTEFKFAVEIGGVIQAGFSECSGLSLQWKVFKYREGGVNNYEHQLPERIKSSKVTLKYGTFVSPELWGWCTRGLYDGQVKYVNMSIVMFDLGWEETKRWNLERAYPLKWKGPSLKADSKKVAMETLEIAFHGLELEESR